MDYNEHIDKLLDLMASIKPHEITILTGGNGRGKSLIRKQMPFVVKKMFNLDDNQMKHSVKAVSMQTRTESRPDFGALSSAMHDWPTTPTSISTFRLIENVLKYTDDNYIVLDEIEIGMSAESIAGICEFLNKRFDEMDSQKCYGVLVITHSDRVVRTLKHDAFLNIEGLSEEQWLNREIIPTDFEELDKEANELFRAIQERSK